MPLFDVEKYIGSPRKYLYLLKENYYIQFGNINYPHKRPINDKISERSDGIVIIPLDLGGSDNNSNLINDKINGYLYQGIPVLIPDKYKSWDIYYPLYYSKYSEIDDLVIKNTELILKTHYYIKIKFNIFESEKTDRTNSDKNIIISTIPTPRKHNLPPIRTIRRNISKTNDINSIENFRSVCKNNIRRVRPFNLDIGSSYCVLKPAVCFIEFDRKFEHLEFLIYNAMIKLGREWSYLIVCGNNNYEYYLKMVNTIVPMGVMKVINYPIGNCDINKYNQILCSKQFWDMIPNEKILIHQEDAFIFHGEYIQQFMEYDYIGAPWSQHNNDNIEGVGNGGFSLRSKSVMLKVIDCVYPNDIKPNSSTEKYMKIKGIYSIPEDVYFSKSILDFNLGKVANQEIARKFSIETIYEENAFGGHQFWLSNNSVNWNKIIIKIFGNINNMYTDINQSEIEWDSKLYGKNTICENLSTKKCVIFFPIINFNFRFQRSQHLATLLSKNYDYTVLYLDINVTNNTYMEYLNDNLIVVNLYSIFPHLNLYNDSLKNNCV